MTLREAIQAVNWEHSQEQGKSSIDRKFARKLTEQAASDFDAIDQSGIVDTLFKWSCMYQDGRETVWAAVRFGMRVQRKLDHPERVTTVYHSEGHAGSPPSRVSPSPGLADRLRSILDEENERLAAIIGPEACGKRISPNRPWICVLPKLHDGGCIAFPTEGGCSSGS